MSDEIYGLNNGTGNENLMLGNVMSDNAPLLTRLDTAYAALENVNQDKSDALYLRFYESLADQELFLLLENEPDPEENGELKLAPHIFDLETGRFILVFDQEERLSAFCGGVAPYVALMGRALAQMIKGQGIGVGVNLGVAPSSMLLPAKAMDWLSETLEQTPKTINARPKGFFAPIDIPEALLAGLQGKLVAMPGLATKALLAQVLYDDEQKGYLLGFIGVDVKDEPALAKAVFESMTFLSDPKSDEIKIDVAFFCAHDPLMQDMQKVALELDLKTPKKAPPPSKPRRKAPGMNPDSPPILR